MENHSIVGRTLVGSLESHRRVVLPGFGAFIRKHEGGEVAFVEFVRTDDGVIRSRLVEQTGFADSAAALAIENYVERLRRELAEHGFSLIPGLGRLIAETGGGCRFEYEPAEGKGTSAPAKALPVQPKSPPAPGVSGLAKPTPVSGTKPTIVQGAAKPIPLSGSTPSTIVQGLAKPVPESVSGAHYGKPNEPEVVLEMRRDRRRRRGDAFLIIAVIAALIAIGAMIYGILNNAPHRMPLLN
ncbi:MAG: hypothetical protein LBH06_04540 [Rikenellaceae bacterium]|jgi:nucleoid DNA-binding protein|nr:hypothetical protein [Rikenellaceae bacterium]